MTDTKKQQLSYRYPESVEITARFREFVDNNYPSMRQFCQKAGINQTQLARVLREENIFSGDMLYKIARAGCDMGWLFSGNSKQKEGEDDDIEKQQLLFYIERLEKLLVYKEKS